MASKSNVLFPRVSEGLVMREVKMPWIIFSGKVPKTMRRASRAEKKAYLKAFHSSAPEERVEVAKLNGFPSGWDQATIETWLLIHRNFLSGDMALDEEFVAQEVASADRFIRSGVGHNEYQIPCSVQEADADGELLRRYFWYVCGWLSCRQTKRFHTSLLRFRQEREWRPRR